MSGYALGGRINGTGMNDTIPCSIDPEREVLITADQVRDRIDPQTLAALKTMLMARSSESDSR